MIGVRSIRSSVLINRLASLRNGPCTVSHLCSPPAPVSVQGSRCMAAIKNWRTPSMDEDFPVPKEPWAHANARRQRRYNAVFFGGLAFLGLTIAYGNFTGDFKLYGTPSIVKDFRYVSKYDEQSANVSLEEIADEHEAPEVIDTVVEEILTPVEEVVHATTVEDADPVEDASLASTEESETLKSVEMETSVEESSVPVGEQNEELVEPPKNDESSVAVGEQSEELAEPPKNDESSVPAGEQSEELAEPPMDDSSVVVPVYAESLPEHVPYLLIGAGTAAFSAYRAIKALDAKAKILIVGEEERLPYMRPPLSKELWYGSTETSSPLVDQPHLKFRQWNGRERSIYFEPEQFYTPVDQLLGRDNGGISILKGHRVEKIDTEKQVATLDDGRTISYGKCLIATGGSPKNIPAFNELQDKVTLFRKLDDYFRLAEVARKIESVVVVGGGFLGSELACALAVWNENPSLKVTQIFPEAGNLAKVLPEYLSKWTTDKVRAEGVTVIPNAKIKSAELKDNKLSLTTSSGETVTADHAVIAVGIEPDVSIAKSSNLEIDTNLGGYRVNDELETKPNLWVAGDAASFQDVVLGRRRVEHHDNAVVSGKLAGENMAGSHKKFSHQSMFWSDLGPDVGFEAIGIIDSKLPTVGVFAKASPKDSPKSAVTDSGEELRKSEVDTIPELKVSVSTEDHIPEDYGKGVIFYLRENIIVGVLMWNVFNKISLARKVIREQKPYEDLAEVAKLFNIHQKDDDELPTTSDEKKD